MKEDKMPESPSREGGRALPNGKFVGVARAGKRPRALHAVVERRLGAVPVQERETPNLDVNKRGGLTWWSARGALCRPRSP